MGEHRGGLPAAAGGLQAAAGELRAVRRNLYDYVADRPPQLGGLDVNEQTYRAEFRHLEFVPRLSFGAPSLRAGVARRESSAGGISARPAGSAGRGVPPAA